MAAICLSLFAIALSLVQISCSKTEAQYPPQQTASTQTSSAQATSAQTATLNKILVKEEFAGTTPHTLRYSIMNYDGSGVQQLNIPFPAGFSASTFNQSVLSPDGTKIFFAGRETAFTTQGIYSCDTSGLNLTRIASCDPNAFEGFVTGAY